ncbi:MAG: helix-turn-helix domain-containing protein [Nakamurella sp.]
MEDSILVPAEVAEMTRLPLGTLRYMRHCGTGPRSFKLGRRVLYRQGDVEAWIASQYQADQPTPAA